MAKCLVLPALWLYSLFVQVTAKPDLTCAKERAQCFTVWSYCPMMITKQWQWKQINEEQPRADKFWNSERAEIPCCSSGIKSTSRFHVPFKATLFSSFLFIAKSKSHEILSRLRVFLGNLLKTVAQMALGQIAPFFSLSGHGVISQFSSLLRQHHWTRNLQQAYRKSRETKCLLAVHCLHVGSLGQCLI